MGDPHELWSDRQKRITDSKNEVPLSPHESSGKLIRFKRMLFSWHTLAAASLIFFGMLILYAGVTYILFARDLTTPENIMNRNNQGLILYDKNGATVYRSSEAKQLHPVPLSQIPKVIQDATIAAEDAQFLRHPGFSYRGIARSIIRNILSGELTRYGGSTITQQLVKNSLVGQEQTINRKFKELVLAIEIERRYSKDQILEMYLNSVYYGSNAFGVKEAYAVYFGKDIAQVNVAQAAFLAALPNAPSYLSPHSGNLSAARKRQAYVLQQMVINNLITWEEAENAKQASLHILPKRDDPLSTSPHFALFVKDQVFTLFDEDEANRRGFRVYTTLDGALQKTAEEEVARQVKALARFKAGNGALVAMEPESGAIIAMVGSADWENDAIGGKFNAAVHAKRQPGSSIKPIVYLAALAASVVTPVSALHDKPTDFGGGYRPKNYDGKFRGDVTVRRALASSLNVPSVELLNMVGVERAVHVAQMLGITTLTDPSRYGLSLVLGGGEVTLLELTGAYGVIANKGIRAETHAIIKIEDKFGQTVYTHDRGKIGPVGIAPLRQLSREVIVPGPAYLVSHILSDNAARAEIFGEALTISRQAAVKTGTTDDYRDSWTIGFTPQLVVGVWVGNSDNSPMTGIAGSLGAAPIWRRVMERGLSGKPAVQFVRPAGVEEVKICTEKKLRDENGIPEVFLSGSEPQELCNPPTEEPSPVRESTPHPISTETASPTPSPSLIEIPLPL